MGRVDGWPTVAPHRYIGIGLVWVLRTYTCFVRVGAGVDDRFCGGVPKDIEIVAGDAAEACAADYERHKQGSEVDSCHFPSLSYAGTGQERD